MRFENNVLFVTGGAAGLGAATAQRFADEGAKVVVADINTSAAEEVAASLPDAIAVAVDTADPASVERAINTAVSHYGRIGVVFNNAGIAGDQQALHETTLDNWSQVTGVNGYGVFYVLKYSIGAMLETGGGAIINTSSTAGLAGQDNVSAYTFTKAGVIGPGASAADPVGSASSSRAPRAAPTP